MPTKYPENLEYTVNTVIHELNPTQHNLIQSNLLNSLDPSYTDQNSSRSNQIQPLETGPSRIQPRPIPTRIFTVGV